MEFSQEAMYRTFGMEPPAAEPEKPETPAEPEIRTEGNPGAEDAVARTETGEPEKPAGAAALDQEGPAAEGGKEPEEKPEQSLEERRQHAAQRRRREQQAAIEEAVEKARQEQAERLQKAIAQSGMKNPMNGEPITTLEELESYNRQMKLAKAERELKGGKLTPETLQDIISDHPAIKRAEEIARRADDAEREARETALRSRMDAEVAQIGKLNPAIKSVEDILAMPTGKAFYDYVQKGNSFVDAYYLANREAQKAQVAAEARQQALNLANSKAHLTQDQARGQGAPSVPADKLRIWRAFNPGASDADIQKYYAKYENQK